MCFVIRIYIYKYTSYRAHTHVVVVVVVKIIIIIRLVGQTQKYSQTHFIVYILHTHKITSGCRL